MTVHYGSRVSMDQSLSGDGPTSAPIEWHQDRYGTGSLTFSGGRSTAGAWGAWTSVSRWSRTLPAGDVSSLRDLTQEESLAILSRLGSSAPATKSASLWDRRDEDTWIDRI